MKQGQFINNNFVEGWAHSQPSEILHTNTQRKRHDRHARGEITGENERCEMGVQLMEVGCVTV